MKTTRPGRAVRLASTLVAASLVLGVAPQMASATDDDTLTLTPAEADALAARLGAPLTGGEEALEATDAAPATDESAAQAEQDTAAGATGDVTQDAGTTVDPRTPVKFTAASTLEGVRGLGVTLPAGGERYFTLHARGAVQLHDADGGIVWERTTGSLVSEWGVKPVRVWETTVSPPTVVMGYNAVSPFLATSGSGYDTADLTGDGTPDVVMSAAFGFVPPVNVSLPGSTLGAGTIVTVLDGATGTMAWSKVFSYATTVKVVGDTLLVGTTPRSNRTAPAAEKATLTGIRFTAGNGVLTPASTWTYDTGLATAATWGDIEDLGDGRVAVSWSQGKTATTAAAGRTVVLDVADGSQVWRTDGDLYPRLMDLDDDRGRLVALEQSDYTDGVEYAVVAYDVSTGEREVLSSRENAFATAMTVGDAAAAQGTEYVVSESTLDANLYVNSATIRVLSGDDASVRWTSTTKRPAGSGGDAASTWDLDAAGGLLVATSQDATGMDTAENPGGLRKGTLTTYTAKGAVKWRQQGTAASPMFQQVFTSGGKDYVRVVDQSQNVRTYTVAKGKQTDLTPLQGEVSVADTVDLDGDGKVDVVGGGISNGVWAWKGASLTKGSPKKLWQATVPGEVHDVQSGDVNGDGRPEVLVAADTATVVLDGANGNVLTTIDGGGAYVRDVAVTDVNGDGKDEVVVPTDALRVYDARGRLKWSYAAPAAAGDVVFGDPVFGDGRVYAQYSSIDGLARDDAAVNGVALAGSDGSVVWTADPQAPADAVDGLLRGAVLRRGMIASPKIPYADGHAVVYTWIIRKVGSNGTATPFVVTEIRDGRTGEVLQQRSTSTSPWSFDGYFIDEAGDPLYALSFGTLTGYAPGAEVTQSSVAAPLRGVDFATGPGGRSLLLGGVDGGVGAWDPSVLTSGWSFQSSVGSASVLGGRNFLAADLNADGVDEILSLGFDDFGYDRMAALLGSRVLSIGNYSPKVVTFTLS